MNLLEEAKKRVAQGLELGDVKYECDTCKDCGFIALDLEGQYKAAIDVPSSLQVAIRICNCKIQEGIRTNMKHSGLDLSEYDKKTLKAFKTKDAESKAMKELALKFLADYNATGIGYFGKSGTGKTHICIAILQELSLRGIQHRYFNYRADIQVLKQLKYNFEDYSKKMDDFKNCTVLYIDDLFKLAQNNRGELDQQELQIIFEIINTRYMNNKTTIFSSELTVNEIKGIDEATGSRIFEMLKGYGMKCEGQNKRFQGGK